MDFFKQIADSFKRLRINACAETFICKKCGKEYISRGKMDPGICPECKRENTFIGGPLDGLEVGDLYDETGS